MSNLILVRKIIPDPICGEDIALWEVWENRRLVEEFAYKEDAQEFINICEENDE